MLNPHPSYDEIVNDDHHQDYVQQDIVEKEEKLSKEHQDKCSGCALCEE